MAPDRHTPASGRCLGSARREVFSNVTLFGDDKRLIDETMDAARQKMHANARRGVQHEEFVVTIRTETAERAMFKDRPLLG